MHSIIVSFLLPIVLTTIVSTLPRQAFAADATTGGITDVRLEPARVAWSQVRMSATKLLVAMRVDVSIGHLEGPAIGPELLATPEGVAVAVDDDVTRFSYMTETFGRHSEVNLLLDADSGAAVQRTAHDSGKRLRFRSYRFTDIGAMRRTVRPRDDERNAGPNGWSDRSEELRAYPENMPPGPVTEASALIYLVAASALSAPGDQMQILAYSSSSDVVHRVNAIVTERDKIRVDFQERGPDQTARREGKRRGLRVRIDGQPLPDQDDDEFELLGMSDIELLLDPDTRAPLRLIGRIPVFGRIEFNLDELTLRE